MLSRSSQHILSSPVTKILSTGTTASPALFAESHGYVTFIRKSASFVAFLNFRLTGRICCFYVVFQLTGARAMTAGRLCDSRSHRSVKTGPIGTQGDPCGSPQWPQHYCLVLPCPIAGIRPPRGSEQPSRPPIPDPVSAHCHRACGARFSGGQRHIASRARNPIAADTMGRTTLLLLATGERIAATAACITR